MGPSEQRALFGDFLRVESGAQQADDDELPLSLGHVAHVEMQANRSIHDSGCISPYTFPVHKPVQYSSSGRAVRASLRSLDGATPVRLPDLGRGRPSIRCDFLVAKVLELRFTNHITAWRPDLSQRGALDALNAGVFDDGGPKGEA